MPTVAVIPTQVANDRLEGFTKLMKTYVFSERELMFMFAICRRPSVCRLSLCRLSVVCRL